MYASPAARNQRSVRIGTVMPSGVLRLAAVLFRSVKQQQAPPNSIQHNLHYELALMHRVLTGALWVRIIFRVIDSLVPECAFHWNTGLLCGTPVELWLSLFLRPLL